MAFDPNLDVTLDSRELAFNNTRITVSIKQYNEGEKKIQIGREVWRNEDWSFAKLGRMTQEEAKGVSEALQELVAKM